MGSNSMAVILITEENLYLLLAKRPISNREDNLDTGARAFMHTHAHTQSQ